MVGTKRNFSEVDGESSSNASSSNAEPEDQQEEVSDDSGSHRSSSVPDELSPTSIRDQLRYCLPEIRHVGSFTAYQSRQKNVDPGLHVNGIGNISLPLTLAHAEAIMKAGAQSPFGRGSETVVDINFRNTKELNRDQFELRNSAWEPELQHIVTQLCQGLGFRDVASQVRFELYKLLLYEKGAMFKAHKDSEKAEGMFGTLVICLPSQHSGGSVVLSHQGETIVFETAAVSEFGQSYIAWYSDVIHEVKPVESGYQLVLTYNLIRTGYKGPTSAIALVDEKAKFQRILTEWNHRSNAGQPALGKLAWILDHKYSQANLALERLKGRDDLLGRYMADICEKENFKIMFAKMTLTVFEANREDGDDELEQKLVLSDVVKADGRLAIGEATIMNEEIIQEDSFDRTPDDVEAEETDNEGVDETHFYHDAVLLLMPEASYLEFMLAHFSPKEVALWIKNLTDGLENDPKQTSRKRLIQICTREAKTSFHRRGDWLIARVIEACITLKDAPLLLVVAEGCSASRPGSVVHHAIAQALRVLPFLNVKPTLDELTRYNIKLHLNLIAIKNVRSHYENQKAENTTLGDLSELKVLKVWEKARIEEVIRCVDQLVPEDAPQLVDIIKCHGEDLAYNHVLPLLKKHNSRTEAVISCLAEIFEAGRSNEISQDTAGSVFNEAVRTTTSALSFQDSYPKNLQQQPFVHPNLKTQRYWVTRDLWNETKLVKHVVNFYCQCLSTHHLDEATAVLNWLESEVDTANISIFHEFIFQFLVKLPGKMQQYGVFTSQTQQKCCQHMVLAFLNRCVGVEPAKPTNWTRPPHGCKYQDCLLCPKLDDFLHDPDKEIAYYEHQVQYSRCYRYYELCCVHEVTRNYKMEDGKKMLRVKKTDREWANAHEAWRRRCDQVADLLKHGLAPSRPLLGERYDELVEMRPIKIST